ncbi:hypothetical protein NEPAR04_1738 [Nematocida parisii]|nr:hypothetical protein NEPAR08_1009 [Nematocida parisii]KAI5130038.1 hypothetical protein NEPAR08_1829 [Nematocida parisii]KAI5130753.1 hypothetical protein NEPAR03_2198 [Nematocida parisii]KAI5141270.1 hypothetical protein NEPAR04_0840 [Nematocida parisii]KAI5143073.1 hypothetical protein NEPAR04_1738 [Nematocida parisii]
MEGYSKEEADRLLRVELDKIVTTKIYKLEGDERVYVMQQRLFEILDSAKNTAEEVDMAVRQCVVYFIRSLSKKKILELKIPEGQKSSLVWVLNNAYPMDSTRKSYSMFLPLVKMYKNRVESDSMGRCVKDMIPDEFADLVLDELIFWANVHSYAQSLPPVERIVELKEDISCTKLLEVALDTVKVYEYKLAQIQRLVPMLIPRCKKISFHHIHEDSADTIAAKIEKSSLPLSQMIDRSIKRVLESLKNPEWDPYACKDVKFLKGILDRWNGPSKACYNLPLEYYREILTAYAAKDEHMIYSKLSEYSSYIRTLRYVSMPLSKCVSKKTAYMDGDLHGRDLFLQAYMRMPNDMDPIPLELIPRGSTAKCLTKTQLVFNLITSTVLELSCVFFLFASSAMLLDVSGDTSVNFHGFTVWGWKDTLAFLGWRGLCLGIYTMCLYIAHKQIDRWFGLLGMDSIERIKLFFLVGVIIASTAAGYAVAVFASGIMTSPSSIIVLYTMGAVLKISNLIDIVVRRTTYKTREVISSTWPTTVASILIFLAIFFIMHIKSITQTVSPAI